MEGRSGRRTRRGQFLILTAAILVVSVLLISTILNAALISRTEYVETNFREATQKVSIDFPKALAGALSNASLTYRAEGSVAKALSNAETYLANWRKNIMDRYVGFGIKLNISDPVIKLEWETPDEGRSYISADVQLTLTALGFSGWNDTETVGAYAQVHRSPDSVIVTPHKVTFNMTFVREDGSPMASLTNDLIEIRAHYVGAQKAYHDINMSTATLRYFGNGLYNVTAETDRVIDAFQLYVYDDRGIVVGLTTDLAVPPDVAVVKSIKLTTAPDRTKASVKVVSTSNQPIEGATIYGHWEGNVTPVDRRPVMIKTDANGMAEFTASSSSLFKVDTTNSNIGRIDFKVDDILFVPVINITSPSSYASGSPAWSNPSKALADGGSTHASASTSNAIVSYMNYNFKIPSYVKIMNVWLRLDLWTTTLGDDYVRVEISYDNGLTFPWSANVYPIKYGTYEPKPSSTYPIWIQLNSTSQSGWDATQLKNTPFFFRLTKITVGTNDIVYLDFIPIVILYQPNYRYEPLRSVTQATAVKRGASTFVGTWSNAANALRNDTSVAYAYKQSNTTILRPNADGTYQQWTTFGNGSSHWGRTSDQSDSTGVQIIGSTSAKETEDIQNANQTGTINSVTAYIRAKATGGITFVGAGTGSGTTINPSPAYPSGLQSDDLILLQVTVRDTNNTPTTPTGFTLLYGPDSTEIGRQWIYYRFSNGSESGNIRVTIAGSSCKMARMYAFRGVALANFTEGGGFNFGWSTTISPPSVTTSGNDRLAVAFVLVNDDNTVGSFAGESGGDWVEAKEEFRTAAGRDGCIQLQIAGISSATTISGGAYTMSASDPWGVRAFALKPVGPEDKAVIVWRTYSTDFESPEFTVSNIAFSNYSQTLTTNPNTGLAWTFDEINDLQIGVRATAVRPNEYVQVSEFWIVVNYTIPGPLIETYYGFGFSIPSEAIIDYLDIQSDLRLQTSGNDYVNISLSRDSGASWMPAQPFSLSSLTTTERTYHVNATGWFRWTPGDLNGDDFQVRIIKLTDDTPEQVNLDYLSVYVVYHIKPVLSPRLMHVDNVTLSQQGMPLTSLRASVKIVNARIEPVSTARVYVNITDMTNHSSRLLNVNTASDGVATFTLTGVQLGHLYTLTVNNVTKTDWVYDPESNYESSKSYTVT